MTRVPPKVLTIEQRNCQLHIAWIDGHQSVYEYIWLRDACRCADCGDPLTANKRLSAADIPQDIRPSAMVVNDKTLHVTWHNDGHQSSYGLGWLRAHCNCPQSRAARRHRPILWDASLANNLPIMSFEELEAGQASLLRVLEYVRDLGIAVIQRVPTEAGALERLAGEIGYIRETNYGRVYDLVVEPDARLLANRGDFVPPHTDEAYRHHTQGLALFHCLQAANDGGGSTILVDGFKVAEDLRRDDPEAFRLLSLVPARFEQRYDGLDLRADVRLINCDLEGNITGVRFNTLGAIPPDLPQEYVARFYDAVRALSVLHRDRQNWLALRLEPGNLVIVDNERVLHGRMAFDPAAGRRHLRLCYIDRDGYHSTLRVLARKLGQPGAESVLAGGAGN
jgi:gamma-butyrobetaine dioxygenase